MEESRRKGTVTSLSSLFPVEEAQKAVKHIEDSITERKNELDRLRGFIGNNNNLINLVQKLPEKLSHDIMVPFGKAAFFPGRLIHTNEFLVLLGEGYYAERTSKEAIEILQRRGKSLASQVDSLHAMIRDLEAEASFFNTTASEAAEGLVDILEEEHDVEEDSNKAELRSGPLQHDPHNFESVTTKNEDFDWMSRMDELEIEEEMAAQSGGNSDLNEETTADFDDISYQGFRQGIPLDQTKNKTIAAEFQNEDFESATAKNEDFDWMSKMDELEKEEMAAESGGNSDRNEETTADFDDISYQGFHQGIPLDQTKNKTIAAEFQKKHDHQEDITDQVNLATLALQSNVREENKLVQNVKSVDLSEKLPVLSVEKTVQAATASKVEHRHQTSQPSFDSRKAFTGSIIEHAENLRTTSREQNSTSSQVSGSQSSKPVSRFKMQRR